MERAIADEVQQVLGIDSVPSVHSDLFGLGLTSLGAVRLRQALGGRGLEVGLSRAGGGRRGAAAGKIGHDPRLALSWIQWPDSVACG